MTRLLFLETQLKLNFSGNFKIDQFWNFIRLNPRFEGQSQEREEDNQHIPISKL